MPNKTIYAVAWSPDGRWHLAAAGNAIGSTTGFTAGAREEYSCGTKTIVGVGGDATYSSLREAPPRRGTGRLRTRLTRRETQLTLRSKRRASASSAKP